MSFVNIKNKNEEYCISNEEISFISKTVEGIYPTGDDYEVFGLNAVPVYHPVIKIGLKNKDNPIILNFNSKSDRDDFYDNLIKQLPEQKK